MAMYPDNTIGEGKKEFRLKIYLTNVSRLQENFVLSNKMQHFGYNWEIKCSEKNGLVNIMATCDTENDPMASDIDMNVKMVFKLMMSGQEEHIVRECEDSGYNGRVGIQFTMIEAQSFKQRCDKALAEVHITISDFRDMNNDIRNVFGDGKIEVMVGPIPFYVDKYRFCDGVFVEMIKNMQKNNETKIYLTEHEKFRFVDAYDMQHFLAEMIDQDALTYHNVEAVFLLAVRFRVRDVVDACESFVLKSNMPVEKKFQIFTQNKRPAMQDEVIESLQSCEEVERIQNHNHDMLDKEQIGHLLKKSLSFP